ncbi:MFS transporter [Oscillochloris sp. ZM17-4]|uniref:MDR family MFS transporter n=1 Tax=Oscillochloris sp. ZM17-4 TaxID=2866714 RepID=UPI001C73D64E|nr:MDR family MFS transporter [Oscillochloris sp. ZM17-4]MBX0329618.1 MFS transporter [Oscillochloris sp. ZM17-4]
MATTTAPSGTRIDYTTALDQPTKMIILVGVLLSLFLSSLDQTIVSTALPRIVADLQGIELLAWVSTAYLLASTAMVPIYGKLSDIYGRKIILLFGIVVFLTGSALCGLSQSMIQLVIFRGIQGFGAAALTSTAFAIPADLFAPAERARYMGLFGAAFGLSSVVGPFVGGLLTDNISWHWVFYVNLPIGLLALTFIIMKMPKLDSGVRSPIDYFGSITLILAVVPLLLALTLDKTQHAWGSPLVVGLITLSVVGLALFLFAERRAAAPILPLHLFRNRTYTMVNLIGVSVGATLFAAIFFLSLYLVNVLGVSATEAGTTLIPLTLSLVFGSIVSSAIVQRIGRYKVTIIVGMSIIVASLWWLTTIQIDTSIWMVRLRMIALGLGLGPALPLLNLAMQNAVPREDVGSATASRQFFQQIGQVVGSAVFGAVLTTTLTSSLAANLAPIQAELPPAMAAQIDPSALRNGSAGGEGATGQATDPSARITQEITAQFTAQRDLLTKAIRDGDPAAIAALKANAQTPPELLQLLDTVDALPAAARDQALAGALQGLDQAQATAIAQGEKIGGEISLAVKHAFTESIASIYRYASVLAIIALILSFFVPELPLRRGGEPAPMPVME